MRTWRWTAAAVALACAAGAYGVSGASAGQAAGFEKGYRALNLAVHPSQIAGLAVGDRVDILVTFEAEIKAGTETVTATLLQNVKVLGVFKDEATVRLQVNPNEAQYAALGRAIGEGVWLLVRGEGDEEMKPMEMASMRKLFK